MRVLVCTDGSEFGDKAVDFVAELFKGSKNAEIVLVTVVEPAEGTELESIIESVDDLTEPGSPAAAVAQSILDRSRERFEQHAVGDDVRIETRELAGPPERVICETAEQWPADLIVIGSHGKGVVQRALFGTVSERVLHHAHCPVLVVK